MIEKIKAKKNKTEKLSSNQEIEPKTTKQKKKSAFKQSASETKPISKKIGVLGLKAKQLHPWYLQSNDEIAALGGDMLQVCYGFFDRLMETFPQDVHCEVLGHESTELEIREYWIKPRHIGKMRIAPPEINTFPTLLMISGQHGQEYSAIVNVMLMLHHMFYEPRQYPTLSLLRSSFHLRIIPCLNPWGVKNAKRRNARYVDLNRNFSVGWLKAQGNKGEAALSEIESQILLNWVKQHKEQTLCFLNFHDHSDLAVSWGCASEPFSQRILLHAFQKFSVWYHQHFDDPNPEISLTWLGVPRDGYSDKHIGEVLEVPTLLFECPYINHARISNEWSDVRSVSLQLLIHVLDRLLAHYYHDHPV